MKNKLLSKLIKISDNQQKILTKLAEVFDENSEAVKNQAYLKKLMEDSILELYGAMGPITVRVDVVRGSGYQIHTRGINRLKNSQKVQDAISSKFNTTLWSNNPSLASISQIFWDPSPM